MPAPGLRSTMSSVWEWKQHQSQTSSLQPSQFLSHFETEWISQGDFAILTKNLQECWGTDIFPYSYYSLLSSLYWKGEASSFRHVTCHMPPGKFHRVHSTHAHAATEPLLFWGVFSSTFIFVKVSDHTIYQAELFLQIRPRHLPFYQIPVWVVRCWVSHRERDVLRFQAIYKMTSKHED